MFGQFWTETAVMLTGSLAVALLLMEAAAPFYKALAGKTFSITLLDARLWKVTGLTFAGVWAMTAIYPALLLSSFRPTLGLKGEWLPGGKAGSLRKGLIVMQFAASAGVAYGQLPKREGRPGQPGEGPAQ